MLTDAMSALASPLFSIEISSVSLSPPSSCAPDPV
jgi:hypothetical protein